jgi:hypothetical protein
MFRAAAFTMGLIVIGATTVRADSFDYYTNPLLAKVAESKSAEKVDKLTTDLLVDNARVLPGVNGAFVVVKTNDHRWSKLLVQAALHKIDKDKAVPIAQIERFVTFREGEERTVLAKGENVRLFNEFRFNLDYGQVVPASLGGDLRFVADGDKVYLEPIGKAEMYLVTKHLVEANPKKGPKVVVGEKFEPRYFNGVYKLYDDGRRSGKLHLQVAENNLVSGYYYSDVDGKKYEVEGKVGSPNHNINFMITFPRTIQQFSGCMFTGDGKAIAGFARMQDRETGFYAVRIEE